MQIGIDSFAAAISDPAKGLTLSPVERMHNLLEEIPFDRFRRRLERCPVPAHSHGGPRAEGLPSQEILNRFHF